MKLLCNWKGALLFGLLIWIVPFAVAIPFYSPQGEVLINETAFKTLMIVVGSAVGAIASIIYFRKVDCGYSCEGVRVGMLWMAISWLLDMVTVVPMAHMDVPAYFTQIGLRYLPIMMMTVAIGTVLEMHAQKDAPVKKAKRRK